MTFFWKAGSSTVLPSGAAMTATTWVVRSRPSASSAMTEALTDSLLSAKKPLCVTWSPSVIPKSPEPRQTVTNAATTMNRYRYTIRPHQANTESPN
ncbi:Uncharacterised protein [Mycobacteroides abscessus subsp. abscessus]|nr:Uncharacterised protein [Mycobacteroides abscessus subsp. abscessus]SHU39389.1 Uncharacterised protein [Mycobacteroides abscessus subsp. abscessus]SHW70618.1 Uncharacterised protein [Mycobacteroides abscessus subsp. abscessus]SKV07574.1 Uncharacterised protein [Mycobacteroides abscessus subsp. abscessus]